MICPRCELNELAVPQALNALSRTTRGENDVSVYVCSPCGSDEGINEYFNDGTEPQTEWPVKGRVWPDGQKVVWS